MRRQADRGHFRVETSPAFHARDMARLIPRAKLLTVPGARHTLPLEALDLLGERILAEALPGA